MKDSRIIEQNSTIKTLKNKVNTLEKSLAKLNSKFTIFQCKSVTNIVHLEHKKELIEIKDKGENDVNKKNGL